VRLNSFEPGGVEAVEAGESRIRVGPVARQGPQVPEGRDQFVQAIDFI
jgi:hypothetical protein